MRSDLAILQSTKLFEDEAGIRVEDTFAIQDMYETTFGAGNAVSALLARVNRRT